MGSDANAYSRTSTSIWAVIAVGLMIFGVMAGAWIISEKSKKPAPHATIIAVNDIYRPFIADKDLDKVGGLHRLRTFRKEIEQKAPEALLLHAGDFLSPSLLSLEDKGAHMVTAMNALDGDLLAFDQRFFVTFGNHEFDDSDCEDGDNLVARVNESDFTWLNSNLQFGEIGQDGKPTCPGLFPLAGDHKIPAYKVVESGGVRIGLMGFGRTKGRDSLLSADKPKPKDTAVDDKPKKPGDPIEFPMMGDGAYDIKAQIRIADDLADILKHPPYNADVIVAVTHFAKDEDTKFLEGARNVDLVIGGHDHHEMKGGVGDRFYVKSNSDARSAWRIDISLDTRGRPVITSTPFPLTDEAQAAKQFAPDPEMKQLGNNIIATLEAEYCKKLEKTGEVKPYKSDCLDDKIGITENELIGEELGNRGGETGLGNWVADNLLSAWSDPPVSSGIKLSDHKGPVVALVNSGFLRLNYDIPEKSNISRRHLHELVAAKYDAPLVKVEITGEKLWNAIAYSIADRGEGGWLHLSRQLHIETKIENDKEELKGLWIAKTYVAANPKDHSDYIKILPKSADKVTVVSLPYVLCGGNGHPFGELKTRASPTTGKYEELLGFVRPNDMNNQGPKPFCNWALYADHSGVTSPPTDYVTHAFAEYTKDNYEKYKAQPVLAHAMKRDGGGGKDDGKITGAEKDGRICDDNYRKAHKGECAWGKPSP